jgi:hypothetical protein
MKKILIIGLMAYSLCASVTSCTDISAQNQYSAAPRSADAEQMNYDFERNQNKVLLEKAKCRLEQTKINQARKVIPNQENPPTKRPKLLRTANK